MDTEEELKRKVEELAALQRDYDEFVESSKDIETELEQSLAEANERIAAIEKKQLEAEGRNKELQEKCSKLNKESDALHAEMDKLRERVSSLETTRRSLENDNDDLLTQVRVLEASQEDLQQKLLNAEEDVIFLKTDLEELKAVKEELEAKLAETREENKQKTISSSVDETSSLRSFGVDTFTLNEQEAEHQLSEKTRTIDELQLQVASMSTTISTLERDNAELHKQLQSTREEFDKICSERVSVEELQALVKTLTEELEAERLRLASKDSQVQELLAANVVLEEENSSLKYLREEIEAMKTEKELLLEAHQQAQKELRAEQETVLAALRSELSHKTDEAERIRITLADTEKSYAAHREDVMRSMENDIEQLKNELARERESNGTINSEKAHLLHSLEEKKALIEEKDKEIHRLQSLHGENQSALEAEKTHLSRHYDHRIGELEKELDNMRLNTALPDSNAMDKVSDEKALLAEMEEISALRSALSEREHECNMKEQEIQRLQAAIVAHSREITALQANEAVSLPVQIADTDVSVASFRESYPTYKDAYPAIDTTTSNMRRLQQLLIRGTKEDLKKELRLLAGHCESLRASNVVLLNKIQALRGNILVCCRTRPPNDNEINGGGHVIVDASDDSELLCFDSKSSAWKSFAFDKVWKAEANQADVFSDIEPLILSVTDGYNACIMAYGQTGSGKTYTMDGHDDQYGVTYRTIQKIFEVLENKRTKLYTNRLRERQQRKRQVAIEKALREAQAEAASKKRVVSTSTRSDFITIFNKNSHNHSNAQSNSQVHLHDSNAAPGSTKNAKPTPTSSDEQAAVDSDPTAASGMSGMTGSQGENDDMSVKSDLSEDLDVVEDGHLKTSVEISMMEIYNEQVYDLLAEKTGGGQTDGVSCDARLVEGTVVVENLRQVPVQTMEEVMAVFAQGSSNRAVSATKMNERSSRSHLIVQVDVSLEEEGHSQIRGKLYLVDLAGSERVNKSGATGSVMKEAQYINKSLLALGDVMEALDKKQQHIPFRNSKLTFILQNALGGNARTMMIVTVCPTDLTAEESLFALSFATRVRNITLGVARKNSLSRNLEIMLKNVKEELRDTKRKKRALDEQLTEMRREKLRQQERTTGPLELKVKQLEENKKTMDIMVHDLKRQLQDTTSRYTEEKEVKDKLRDELEITQRNLKRALEQAKEHIRESERFSALLKNKERELESMKATLSRHSTTAVRSASPEKQSTAFIQRSSPSPPKGRYHSRQVETEISTPYHAAKKNRFDEQAHNDSTDHQTIVSSLDGMGPPLPVLTEYGKSRLSKLPQRYSTSSVSIGSGSKTSRVSIDRVMGHNRSFSVSSIVPPRRSLGPGSSSSLVVKNSKPSTPVSSRIPRPMPSSPHARLEANGPSTPTATKPADARPTRSPPLVHYPPPAAERGAPGSLVSRIPTLNSRSEEALKRHRMRMERQRAETKK